MRSSQIDNDSIEFSNETIQLKSYETNRIRSPPESLLVDLRHQKTSQEWREEKAVKRKKRGGEKKRREERRNSHYCKLDEALTERRGEPKKEIRIYLFTLRGRARLREMERRQLDKLLPLPLPPFPFSLKSITPPVTVSPLHPPLRRSPDSRLIKLLKSTPPRLFFK